MKPDKNLQANLSTATGSVCFWSWNDHITREEICRQLEEFADGRFTGVIVHSRCGLRIPYLGKEWFELYTVVVEEAKRLQLELWIYDEDGWPSGFGGGRVTACGEDFWIKGLQLSRGSAAPGAPIVAAYQKQSDGYRRLPADQTDGADLFCTCTVDRNYADLLSEEAVRVFIDSTYEPYKQHFGAYFGTVIKGFFTDEPQIRTFPWSPTLAAAWQQKYGGDIGDGLYMLWEETGDWQQFRLRFRSLANELFYRSFTCQIAEWCAENGVMLTGHFSEEDGLFSQMGSNSGVMRQYAAMQLPGIDCLGRRTASPVLAKQVSSVANQLGKAGALCEVFGCAGWDITFEDLLYCWGRLSVLGITKPCFHLSAYSIVGRRKRDYPAFFSYQEPWWQQFPAVTGYIDRLDRLMTEGVREVHTLIIAPTDSVAAYYAADYENRSVRLSCEYRMLLENLLELQLDCELGDETLIADAGCVRNGAFCIGNAAYRQVFVSETAMLRGTTAELLTLFEQAGGTVVYVTEKPSLVDGKPGAVPPGLVVQNRRAMLEKLIRRLGLQRSAALYEPGSKHLRQGAIVHARTLENGKRLHIWSSVDCKPGPVVVAVPLDAPEDYAAYRIDPATGCARSLKALPDEGVLLIHAELPIGGNTVIELLRQPAAPPELWETVGLRPIDRLDVELCDENAYTLDYARFSVNGQPYTEPQPIVRAIDWLYQELKKYPSQATVPIRVCYTVYCDAALDAGGISLVAEDEHVVSIEVNGQPVTQSRAGYWIDRGFGRYAIGALLQPGENQIVLSYQSEERDCDTSLLDGFENEKNRFCYPIEPDCIYLTGQFDVETDAAVSYNTNSYCIPAGTFRLAPPTPKRLGSIPEQGAWFYRGSVRYTFTADGAGADERICLRLKDPRAAAAEIRVGERCRIASLLGEDIDITGQLHEGVNRIEVTLIGHNRNLLGPHHHVQRTTAMVGPNTFAGKVGFEDFVSPEVTGDSSWTDSYSFIPFGCDGICLIRKSRQVPSEHAIF